ncbi:MAG: NEW3 domain-containing protein [Candidatus Aenigmarchaeota archaeon]|nr:NEW3 domain-containing protein [Candidatus Aenigmarchaeota archaeon]
MRSFLLAVLLLLLPLVESTEEVIMNSSVLLKANLLHDFQTSALSYCPNETINVTTIIENIGNNPTIFVLNKTIYNQYGSLFYNKSWLAQPINPLEKKSYYLIRNVTDEDIAGLYDVRMEIKYDNEIIKDRSTFRIKKSYGSLVASPAFIEETVFPGDFIGKNLYLWLLFACQGTTVTLNKTGAVADWIYFSQNPIYLSPEVWNFTKVLIFIDLPWNTMPGTYRGNILAHIGNDVVLYIPVTIHVQTAAIFDLQTEVLSQYKEVCKMGEVKAKINILKIFPPGPMDVNMTYIVQQGNTTYTQKKETIAVTDNLEKFVGLNLPSIADTGIYTYYTILDVATENWKVNISSYDTFNVVECLMPQMPVTEGGKTFQPVEVEEKKLEIKLTRYKLLGIAGNLSSFSVKVKNVGDASLTNIKLKVEGLPLEWLTIYPHKIDTLKPGEESDFLVFVKPPPNAKPSVYQAFIKAINSVESNQEKLLFLLSTDEKNLTRMLYEQAKLLKENASKILLLNCLDISSLKMQLDEANSLFEVAEDYMEKEEYKKSQELFLKVISDYEIVLEQANLMMRERYSKVKIFALPPFILSVKKARENVELSLLVKDYQNFCDNLHTLTKYISLSIVELLLLIVLLLLALYLAYKAYKKYRERKVEERLKEIKMRLGQET